MFGIFASQGKRARHDARNWLHLSEKVYHFRRDQLPEKELKELRVASNELKGLLRDRTDAGKLKIGMQKLESCLRQSGGSYYPKTTMVDNVEFFLVALILFLGIREFVIQPVKIPTNSMYPSYYGMTVEEYRKDKRPVTESQTPGSSVFCWSARPCQAVRPRGPDPENASCGCR